MRVYNTKELCYIWLDSFLGLEYKHKKEILSNIVDSVDIKNSVIKMKDYIISNCGESLYANVISCANKDYLDYLLNKFEDKNIQVITLISKEYPKSLSETPVPPLCIYAKGKIDVFNDEILAVVGSRKNIPLSLSIAKDYAKKLSDGGFTLCTGIAEGVDETVIKTTLENNGKVISVVAGGFDNIYPKTNVSLIDKIAENGVAISEYPPSTVPMPFHFPVRNRIIAGLSKGVVIISAGKKSGTLYTAEYAEDYGKNLFAVPYSIGVSVGVGTNELIKKGAILTDNPEEVLAFYGKDVKKEDIELSKDEREILDYIKSGICHVEKICEKLNKPVFEVSPVISILEIKGVIIKSGFNEYQLSKSV